MQFDYLTENNIKLINLFLVQFMCFQISMSEVESFKFVILVPYEFNYSNTFKVYTYIEGSVYICSIIQISKYTNI